VTVQAKPGQDAFSLLVKLAKRPLSSSKAQQPSAVSPFFFSKDSDQKMIWFPNLISELSESAFIGLFGSYLEMRGFYIIRFAG
jgi:hypothetical protein